MILAFANFMSLVVHFSLISEYGVEIDPFYSFFYTFQDDVVPSKCYKQGHRAGLLPRC